MRIIYLILGFIFLALGVIGIPLPGLPTTPFLLLALACFTRGSERVHQWFIQTSIYHNHLKSFYEKRALTKRAKIAILSFSTPMLLLGIYFTPSVIGRIVIVLAMIAQYAAFLFWVKTEPQN